MQQIFKRIITFAPLVILILISAFFTKKSWDEYQVKKHFISTLEDIKILQDYETSILDESICNLLLSNQKKNQSQTCKERIQKSAILHETLKQRKESLKRWINDIEQIKINSSKLDISDFQKILAKEDILSNVDSYIHQAQQHAQNVEEKQLIQLYRSLSNSLYATYLEDFLLSYYLSKNVPISTSNIIFWDKLITASHPVDLEQINNLSSIKKQLQSISKKTNLQINLSKIDDMRIDILTNFKTKKKEKSDWILLLEKKASTLKKQSLIVFNTLYNKLQKDAKMALLSLIIYSFILFLSFIALIYHYKQYKKNRLKNKLLDTFIEEIKSLHCNDDNLSRRLEVALKQAKSKDEIYHTVSEHFKHLNQRCIDAEKEAKTKSHFLSTLSHEIRTPLNGIIGFSKLLKDIGVTQDQAEFLSLIEGSSQNLISIVNDILDLSKINADKMEIENVSFDIFETIESTVASFTQQAVQKDIELGVFIDPFLPHYFLGDATKLSQILTNLIGNAVKFTNPYGKINIIIQGIRQNEKNAEIKFSVSDNGIGLSQEQIKNIFNPFSQATKSTSNKYGGTGLGLTISSKMVELMGGKLEVKSVENKGANFYFTLTLDKDTTKTIEPYPSFKNLRVGLALPAKSIKRQLDSNLKVYIEYLGAKFSTYYYENLFSDDTYVELPDIMIFDHHYARLSGELEQCSSLDCKTVILTNGSLYSRINPERHHFDDILFTPISLHKCIRILEVSKKEDAQTYSKPSKTIENIESFSGLHALVADDNLINRKLINIILEKTGLTVTLASDGSEAFDKYKEGKFDIIFMDIQMPVMNGVDATRAIIAYEKENNIPHVPIIALTANVGMGDKESYLLEGMDDYATKPLEIDVLKSLISKHCGVSLSSDNKEK